MTAPARRNTARAALVAIFVCGSVHAADTAEVKALKAEVQALRARVAALEAKVGIQPPETKAPTKAPASDKPIKLADLVAQIPKDYKPPSRPPVKWDTLQRQLANKAVNEWAKGKVLAVQGRMSDKLMSSNGRLFITLDLRMKKHGSQYIMFSKEKVDIEIDAKHAVALAKAPATKIYTALLPIESVRLEANDIMRKPSPGANARPLPYVRVSVDCPHPSRRLVGFDPPPAR